MYFYRTHFVVSANNTSDYASCPECRDRDCYKTHINVCLVKTYISQVSKKYYYLIFSLNQDVILTYKCNTRYFFFFFTISVYYIGVQFILHKCALPLTVITINRRHCIGRTFFSLLVVMQPIWSSYSDGSHRLGIGRPKGQAGNFCDTTPDPISDRTHWREEGKNKHHR